MTLADVQRACRGAGLPGANVRGLDEEREARYNPTGRRGVKLGSRPDIIAVVEIPWAGFALVAEDGRIVGTRLAPRRSYSVPDWTAPRPWLVEYLLASRRRLILLYNRVGLVLGEDPLSDGFEDEAPRRATDGVEP